MTKYEFIANKLNDFLGGKYLIQYNNNINTDWARIVQSNTIPGVMTCSGGNRGILEEIEIVNETLTLQFAVPADEPTFSTTISELETLCDNTKRVVFDCTDFSDLAASQVLRLSCSNKYEPSALGVINGVDYVSVMIDFSLDTLTSVVLASDSSLQIKKLVNGVETYVDMLGLVAVNYSASKSFAPITNSTANQSNKVASINVSLNISFVLIKDNELHQYLDDHCEDLTVFKIKYVDGISSSAREKEMYIQNFTIQTLAGDISKATITFIGA